MLKVFSTNVVISKGYDNNPALKFFKDESTNTRSVRFRIGKKIYDSRAENNARWLNYTVKAYNGLCDRIEDLTKKAGPTMTVILKQLQLSFLMTLNMLAQENQRMVLQTRMVRTATQATQVPPQLQVLPDRMLQPPIILLVSRISVAVAECSLRTNKELK